MWQDWSSFWAMGGYGQYVWGSFIVCFLLLAIEIILTKKQKQITEKKLQQMYLAENND